MNCRERVLDCIRFETPDRVPVGYNVNRRALLKYGQPLVDLCGRWPNDFYDPGAVITIPARDAAHYRSDGSYFKEETDAWGCEWAYYQEGIMGEVKRSPLADWSALATYRVPPVPRRTAAERSKARDEVSRQKERYIGWASAGSLFEQMQWLRGVEALMEDIAFDREEIYILADRLVEEFLVPHIELGLEAGTDVVGFSDDWGTQRQLLIHPEAWRRIFRPRYQKLYDLVHQGGALAWLHSDGMILEIVPDLIEMGLDVLNPQLSCHDVAALGRAAAGRLALYGTLDYQRVMPFGTPEAVDAHVRDVTAMLASSKGGFMYGAGIQDDAPFANIEAVMAAMARYSSAAV